MEKSLQLVGSGTLRAADVKVPCSLLGCSLELQAGDFPRQPGLPGKIPAVKPRFKKKSTPIGLDARNLRALGPLLSTLLRSGALVERRDGFFVPGSRLGERNGLCEALVPVPPGMGRGCPKPGGGGVGEPLPPAGTACQMQGQEATGVQAAAVPPNDEALQAEAASVLLAGSACALQADHLHPLPGGLQSCTAGFLVDDGAPRQAGPWGNALFQDKSEESSLDFVFELLIKLQYHTHQSDGIEICLPFLQGTCVYGNDCPRHHTVLPYHWQIRRTATQTWQSISDESQEQLERLYCNPDNDRIRLKYQGLEFVLDLNLMKIYESTEFDQVRRLSTPSVTSSNPNQDTVWKYYCRDHFGWREYSETVVRLIEEATCKGMKEVRFFTCHNQYILNIRDGFQQNAGFRREIKRRPLFRSTVMLTPYLQTLGAVSPATTPPCGMSSSLALSPGPTTSLNLYPETWVSMDPFRDFVQVPVSKDEKSYRTVYNIFHKTVPETKFRILKIQRVQNPFLWEKYKRKKEYMSRKMTEMDKILNERHLFHGTSQDVVDGICKHNFDPRVCGKHATMFGQGSYFAKKASYSHNFSRKSSKGIHHMFLAKVLTGKYTAGNPTMRRPPPLNSSDLCSDLFDSCVDNCFDPQIFVIFNDDQCYPYFIIQYEEVNGTVSI
ncbi:protein mono-ADP-ribosyltransferase TIPARP [Latimeria chalumnae]|uniref:TCDD inducible poly(ADP-ribose) polymerase n=1 Tax=Latimeria chalumnae TaxID=7897 RepID=H3ASW3_LATCH|nr:PREDICTED: TCDD-inducible poly [ADP-ribose] polymerase [Latimeria chalumnae]|eukprot:XP_005987360.1 PREDICTED: TCDD-inducible poly [ADP-ribose] polymerase [Latimeria chalumnae]